MDLLEAAKQAGTGSSEGRHGGACACRESAKKKDVRTTNIESAKAVADAVRTSLGPRGMDKMVSGPQRRAAAQRAPVPRLSHLHSPQPLSPPPIMPLHCPQVSAPNGEVIITNDGATILQKMTVTQPAAKMLVELSKSQVRLLHSCSPTQAPQGCHRTGSEPGLALCCCLITGRGGGRRDDIRRGCLRRAPAKVPATAREGCAPHRHLRFLRQGSPESMSGALTRTLSTLATICAILID